MGGGPTSEYDSAAWIAAKLTPDYTLIKNRFTGQQLRQYQSLFVDQPTLDAEKRIWDKRATAGDNVVKVLTSEKQSGLKSGFCSNSVPATVYTEHVSQTLAQKGLVPRDQGLALMEKALTGFGQVAKLTGKCFPVTEKMIGLTDDGQVKVWLSQNFASNSPDQDYGRKPDAEERMAEDVVEAVGRHMQGGLPRDLQGYLGGSIPRAKQFVSQLRSGQPPQPLSSASKREFVMNLYKGPGSKLNA